MAALTRFISFRGPPEGHPIAIGLISYYLFIGLLAYIFLRLSVVRKVFRIRFPLALFVE